MHADAAGEGLLSPVCTADTFARHNRRTMDRRLAMAALACWPAAPLLATEEEGARPRLRISAAQLYEALSARFPVRLGFGGVLELQVSAPRLLLLPARNKLGAALQAQIAGLPRQQGTAGELEIVFAPRYEPSDQTVRGREAEILDLRWPGLPPETLQSLRALLPAMAQQVGELVLHRMAPRELALPETMGFEPGELQVDPDGVTIFFRPKPRPPG
jgi:hypothetical protein